MQRVYYDLTESEYIYSTAFYDFYFSSDFYLHKFMNNYINYISQHSNKIDVRFMQKCDFYKVLILDYYKKVEKRGFRVYDKTKNKYVKEDYRIKGIIEYD